MEIIGVTETAVQYLRVHIITGDFSPGQKLNEEDLSQRLNISRPPLREAFRVLESEHLLVSLPRRGCYVSELSIQDCRDIFEAREMIECFSIDLLRAKGRRELPEVASILAQTADLPMPNTSDPYDKFEYLKAIADFHIKLVEAAGNLRIKHFYDVNLSSMARYQSMYTFIPGLMNKSQETHEQILDFIKRSRYDQAKEMLRHHISSFCELVGDKIECEKRGELTVVHHGA